MHIFVFKTLKILVKNENTTFLKNGINHANIANEKIHLAHCVKSAVFGFWRECGKIRTRKNPNTDTFHAIMDYITFTVKSSCQFQKLIFDVFLKFLKQVFSNG